MRIATDVVVVPLALAAAAAAVLRTNEMRATVSLKSINNNK